MPLFYKRYILAVACLFFLSTGALFSQDTIRVPKKPRHNDILSRMDFGGMIGLQFGTITYIEVAPMASYRVTEKFHAGLGLTYQYYKANYDGAPDYTSSAYGGSIFAKYYVWRDLFAHVEYAPLYISNFMYPPNIPQVNEAPWAHDIFLGGGYRQWIGEKAFMSMSILWNVNETIYSPYSNPIFRIGFGAGF